MRMRSHEKREPWIALMLGLTSLVRESHVSNIFSRDVWRAGGRSCTQDVIRERCQTLHRKTRNELMAIPRLLLLSLFVNLTAAAQERVITIIGEAELSEPANRAEFTFQLEKDGKTLDDAFANVQAKLSPIVRNLIQIGIDSNSIEQSRLYVDEKFFSLFSSNKIQASVQVRVIIDDLNLLKSVLNIMSTSQIEKLTFIHFKLRDDRSLIGRTLSQAVTNAKASAAAVTQSNGLELGGIVSIVELEPPNIAAVAERPMFMIRGGSIGSYTFPEKIFLTKRVKVTFELK